MIRFITIGTIFSGYIFCLHKIEIQNKKQEQDKKDLLLIECFSRASESKEVNDAYNRQHPVFNHNAYVIDGDTLATENI